MQYYRNEVFPDPEPPEENQHGGRHLVFEILETVLMALVLFAAINAVSARIRVESISMQPTLFAGDFVIVNRLAYQLGHPGRGDVIIFRFPPDPDREPYIKRVIGLPGDTVRIGNNKVYVNDQQLHETYIKAPPGYTGQWVVPEGQLFVLGDNRNNSSDSHSWGFVPLENVIGKAEVVYWPPEDWQLLNQDVAVAAEE